MKTKRLGFLGAGIMSRNEQTHQVFNLTTAAEVWAVAAMGLATAVAPWVMVGLAVTIFIILIVVLRVLEVWFHLKDHS